MLEPTNEALPANLSEAKVIADSISIIGHRVTTFEVTMHRFVLAEFNTHRVFSRNSASSRAIPVKKRMEEFLKYPAFPLTLPSEKPGMQGGVELENEWRDDARWFLENIHNDVATAVRNYIEDHPEPETRLHKSVLARYIEPFLWHRVIVTATDWDGFFNQRISPLAQPEIHYPAQMMLEAYEASTPVQKRDGEWHLPYTTDWDKKEFDEMELIKLSAARCARVSYLTHDGEHDPEKDMKLWDRLVESDPPHASPLEHPCRADLINVRTAEWVTLDGTEAVSKDLPYLGNLLGWIQARHLVLKF